MHLRVDEGSARLGALARGFELRLLGVEHPPVTVEALHPRSRVLQLSVPLPISVTPGTAFEVSSGEEAPILAARLVTGTPLAKPLPPLEMRLATTRGTNALLERRGAPVALFITRGFGDLLRIGTQQRPDLFALDIRRPSPLTHTIVEVPERLAADGTVLSGLNVDELRPTVERLAASGLRSAAVALLHSYRNPRHEEELEALLLEAGFQSVSRSSALAPFLRILPRAETAVVDAYLSPIIGAYLSGVRSAFAGDARPGAATPPGARLHVMTSAGGLVRAEEFRAKDSLLSGPAGGVVGAALAGRRAGFNRVIAFDMGGTSTDVARIDGDYEYVWEHKVAGARLLAPAMAIESVAAGGGSICTLDAEGLRVGPQSAGAVPGPACYGAGGPLTLTDANLLLRRLDPARFGIPLHAAAAEARMEALRTALEAQSGETIPAPALAEGLVALADERMADAIRGISLRKGYDPAEYALVAFGGAGPQHACGVAKSLGIRTIVVPPDAGLLSALGIGYAVIERFAERQVLAPLESVNAQLPAWLTELSAAALREVVGEGVAPGDAIVRRRIASLRYTGQESTLPVEYNEAEPLAAAFERHYREVFGHAPERRPVELESLRVVASSRPDPITASAPVPPADALPTGSTPLWIGGRWTEAARFERGELAAGARMHGPALVWERHTATFIDEGWAGEVDGSGALILRAMRAAATADDAATEPLNRGTVAAVREELFIHRFQALVGEMGEQLRRTALSVNVRERLDFSCALLDPHGELVVNAPHIPVHLGALGLCVRRVRDTLPLGPGDVAVTNHPAFGGSHLPDVTVIAPVFDAAGTLLGYVANRAHHAEIGGTRPGSMPPAAHTLVEEGVVIAPTYLIRRGEARWDAVQALLQGAPHPSRAIDENLADLRAQVAAAHRGATLLRELTAQHGARSISGAMEALKHRAESRVRGALAARTDGVYEAEERLDDGSPLRVRIEIRGDAATLDFSGSAGVHPGNLNATPAIVRSVALYVLRLLVAETLPLNEGLLRAVELRIPQGLLNPPFPEDAARAPAVVGGNIETSQRLVDVLLKALGLAACSQGTMNNVLFGNERFGYYETVCGGAGAGPGWAGASAVHTHMTNTRITDPEVLEHRYPVRVARFEIRRGSGGAGRWPGGDGVVRELEFLEPMQLSVLTQHREERPYGREGGEPGARGRQQVIRASGVQVPLTSVDGCEVEPGDRLILETPGGGGWGRAPRTG